MSIFKAYDIRGVYAPDQVSESFARKLGWTYGQLFHPQNVVVGEDVRLSSRSLKEALIQGILYHEKITVIDVEQVTTPCLYFAAGFLKTSGGIMVTASHNPKDDNGFKITKDQTVALSETSGLNDIRALLDQAPLEKIQSLDFHDAASKKRYRKKSIHADYIRHLLGFAQPQKRSLRLAVDTSHGAVGLVLPQLLQGLPLDVTYLCLTPDGNFPSHEPNPLQDGNVQDLTAELKAGGYDLGVGFDGDGDRCIFFDEKGNRISSDLVTALIAREMLRQEPGAAIVYDLRSSRVVREEVEKAGGKALKERVGHSFIKATMRLHDSPFGGELSGHFYFRDNYFTDCGLLSLIWILNLLWSGKQSISRWISPLQRYYHSGEINFTVQDKDRMIATIEKAFPHTGKEKLDGLTIQEKEYWFNVRKSNTEPLLRVTIEATTPPLLEELKQKLSRMITGGK